MNNKVYDKSLLYKKEKFVRLVCIFYFVDPAFIQENTEREEIFVRVSKAI